MMPDLNEIAASQSKSTLHTKLATDMVLNYSHRYPNTKIYYHIRDMILHSGYDTTYLSTTGARSIISGN